MCAVTNMALRALQAEVARLKTKLDETLGSAEETLASLFQQHVCQCSVCVVCIPQTDVSVPLSL